MFLAQWVKRDPPCPIHHAVLCHGKPFTGIARPKGYRLRAEKQCYLNAGDLALQERGIYVEGFADSSEGRTPVPHAWLTLDGKNAVDVTWCKQATECHYFGIPFPNDVLRAFIRRTGCWGPLLAYDELEQVLKDAGLRKD